MKKLFSVVVAATVLFCSLHAQNYKVMDELASEPELAYGNDYPYLFEMKPLTKSPKGYKPFYISHYARHGSRYYWNSRLYPRIDSVLTRAHEMQRLTPAGESFFNKFEAIKEELLTGTKELTQVGWDQHQSIARTMYNRFPEVFKKGGNVLAISSLSGRCVMSMSAFCQELCQCNPELEIREQSSRFTLYGVVPGDNENPRKREYTTLKTRFEDNQSSFVKDTLFNQRILANVFTDAEGFDESFADDIVTMYTSLPSIGHEGIMEGLVTDEDIAGHWEETNLGSYAWVYSAQNLMIPVLEDILDKAQGAIDGTNVNVADLRFGHDSCIGPLTALMGINGADINPEDPYQVKYCYQNWETCKACNIQLIFYRNRHDDILVKCLLNGSEASLPVKTDTFPYYKWSDFKSYYSQVCKNDTK